MNRKALIAVCVGAALLAAGCSSNSQQASTLSGATAPAGSAAASSTPAANLTTELLTVNDFPAGWTTDTQASSSGSGPSCTALQNGAWKTLPQRAEADFKDSDGETLVTEELDAGPADQVTQAWTAFGTATSTCRTFTSTISGHTVTFQLQDMSFPSYGDKTMAFGLTASVSSLTINADIIVVRKGDTLVQIIAESEFGGVPVDLVENATKTAVVRAK